MAGLTNRVRNYTSKEKGCTTAMEAFDQQQNCLNTLFDIRCEMKKKWGYEWYDQARYGYYEDARRELITKPASIAKTVALQCIDDLEWLQEEMQQLEAKGGVK